MKHPRKGKEKVLEPEQRKGFWKEDKVRGVESWPFHSGGPATSFSSFLGCSEQCLLSLCPFEETAAHRWAVMASENLVALLIPTVFPGGNLFFMNDEILRTQTLVPKDSKQCAGQWQVTQEGEQCAAISNWSVWDIGWQSKKLCLQQCTWSTPLLPRSLANTVWLQAQNTALKFKLPV